MYRIHCLGHLSIQRDGTPVSGEASQPRRLALLAVLARAGDRPITREKILALFWPDADEERGRRALNQALYALRRDLGADDAILGFKDLRLNPAHLTSDVQEFAAARDSGELERAAALYEGPFLDGFSLAGAAEFERWVEETRRTLQAEALELFETLARRAAGRDDSAAAVGWWRRAAALEPTRAPVALALMTALADAGDPAGAIRHARIHAALLEQELDLPPDPAVVMLAERLRLTMATAAVTGGVSAPPSPPASEGSSGAMAVEPVPGVEPIDGAASRAPAGPRATRRHWWPAAAVVALAVLFAAFWLWSGASPAATHRVVVAPFDDRTGDSTLALAGPMVADWLTQGLAATGLVEVLDFGVARSADPSALARETGASMVVSGRYLLVDDSLHFLVQVTAVRGGRVLGRIEPVTVAAQRPAEALEPLRQRVIGALAVVVDERLNNWTALSSRPPTWEAYQEFLLGMATFGDDMERELAHFIRAARLDPDYMQARLWAGISAANLRRYPVADSILTELMEHRDKLAPYDRANLDYFHAGFVRGDWEGSYRGGTAMAALAPAAGHAQFARGVAAFRTRRTREAREALERINLHGGWGRDWAARILFNLTRVHHHLGDHVAELETARRLLPLDDRSGAIRAAEIRALAALGRWSALVPRLQAALTLPPIADGPLEPFSPGELLLEVSQELAAHGHSAVGDSLVGWALVWFREARWEPHDGAAHRRGYARVLDAAGAFEEAAAVWNQLLAEAPEDHVALGGLGLTQAHRGDTAAARAVLDRLLALDPRYRFGAEALAAARIAAALGDAELAIGQILRAFALGSTRHYQLHSDPDLSRLAGHPGFAALLVPRD